MKSSSEARPGRETLTTLPEESQATPFQDAQQSEDDVQEFNSPEGSEVIVCLNSSNASLSTAWHASVTSRRVAERKKRKKNKRILW